MLIQCTRKLLDDLKVEPGEFAEEPLFAWHADIIRLKRRKTVVLTNDQNRYILVLYGLKAKDLRDFGKVLTEAIKKTFRYEQISDDTTAGYLGASPGVSYAKTKNRSMTGRLRAAVDAAHCCAPYIIEDSVVQPDMSARCSTYVVPKGPGETDIWPNREMYKDLLGLKKAPIFQCKAVQLRIVLELGKHSAWRRLLVPIDCSFTQLHRIIQRVFGWQDNHLYEFFILDHRRRVQEDWGSNHPVFHPKGYLPIMNLVGDESALEFEYSYGIPRQLAHTAFLGDYVHDYRIMKYIYDFGDDWRHTIEIEGITIFEDKNFPFCLEGEGIAPPEDVGGISGYEQFLKVIANKDDPDREYMLAWAQNQWHTGFDLNLVNRWLRAYVWR
jgi:hypothetical protein